MMRFLRRGSRLLLLLAMVPGRFAPVAQAQEEGGEVEVENGDGLTAETRHTMETLSQVLCRRALSGGIIRRKGLHIGLDLAMVRIPGTVQSEQVQKVQSSFLAVPMPLLVVDSATEERQISVSGVYLTNSPVPNAQIVYLSARVGFDRFLSRRSNITYGGSFTHTTFRADRSVSLAVGEDQQAFGVQGNNAEMRVAYQTGPGGNGGDPRWLSSFMVFHLTAGFGRTSASFVGEVIEGGYQFASNSRYVGIGGSFCAESRSGCVTTEIQHDATLGIFPAIVTSIRF